MGDGAYPASREADVVLSDGSTAHLRPVRREDRDGLLALFEGLGPESRAFRFFSGASNLKQAAELMSDVDYVASYGLVALRRDERVPVGHALYIEAAPGRAEVAFAVADEMQGKGLGTILLAHLAEVAQENWIPLFFAEVMPQNHRMIGVFRDSGFPIDVRAQPGSIRIELPTSFGPDAIERFEERDRLAAAAAVRRFLQPRAIAVVGASRRRGTVGGEVLHNLLESGFDGGVHPVNPGSEEVQGARAYPSVAALPDGVDLAVIAVPPEAAIAAAEECAEKGVSALVVLSAGFAEVGGEGVERQRRLLEVCRRAGMRLIGPNCLGLLASGAEPRLNATFGPAMPPPGNVGFVSQSGALGLALIELAGERGLGVSSLASIGNRADVTGTDLLEYWESDPATDVAMLYIESFGHPRRFSRVARRAGCRMPVVAVKSGRSLAGGRAAGSHTGALLSASDVTVDALFEQSGVIRTETIAELLDVAALLSTRRLPEGNRVGIVTNAGGLGIMCADACEAEGLEVPELPAEVREKLASFLPAEAGISNPVDMIATASGDQYRQAIATLAEWEGIDALVALYIRPLLARPEEIATAVAEASAALELPVQAVFMSAQDRAKSAGLGLPTHVFPEDAARALGRVMRHVRWRQRPPAAPAQFADARGDEAAALLAEALERGEEWLGAAEAVRLLDCYGIATPGWRLAADPAGAARAAEELGGTVALKAQGPEIVHKTELGAVRVGLTGAAVQRAAEEMDEALARAGVARERFLVQSLVEPGVELLVGVVADPMFGPVLACGAGGTQAELLDDVAVRICPLCDEDARSAIRSLAMYPLLTGYRGGPVADLAALEELVLRISAMVDAHHEIAELDLNPVLARPDGAVAVDARIRIQVAPPPIPWPSTSKPAAI